MKLKMKMNMSSRLKSGTLKLVSVSISNSNAVSTLRRISLRSSTLTCININKDYCGDKRYGFIRPMYRCYNTVSKVDDNNNQRKGQNSTEQIPDTSSSGIQLDGMVLYDSLSCTYKAIPLQSSSSRGMAWYTCGPTVYDSAHLGHARTYVLLDILHRVLLHTYQLSLILPSSHSKSSSPSNSPPPPIFIMNITDVDDKILQRSKELNIPPKLLSQKYESEFWNDMDALNVMRPTFVTRVTDHVESSIIPYIQRIIDNGMAYIIHDEETVNTEKSIQSGSVYFDIKAYESKMGYRNKYGKLMYSSLDNHSYDSHQLNTHDINQDENNINKECASTFFEWDINANVDKKQASKLLLQKKDTRDFVLWKSRYTNEEKHEENYENDDLLWKSPWGYGRPGWHIECSAMIDHTMQHLKNYDIHVHAGGIDLKFPHHTNEIAQAEAYRLSSSNIDPKESKEWIPHWVHTGHLYIRGLKMSKSLKNFVTIRELLSSTSGGEESSTKISLSSMNAPADDFRLWCLGLSGSYRGPALYSEARIEEAKVIREKIVLFLTVGESFVQSHKRHEYSMPSIEAEIQMLKCIHMCSEECFKSLKGQVNASENNLANNTSAFDMNGSAFLQSILKLIDAGKKYIDGVKTDPGRSVEVIHKALTVIRQQLELVGFSDFTVKAGLDSYLQPDKRSNIIGGERNLIEELVRMRSEVRKLALESIKDDKRSKRSPSPLAKAILNTCDCVRNERLPPIGLEIFDDGKECSWRYCTPKKTLSNKSAAEENILDDNHVTNR